jgi:hypothetical protein
MALKVDYYASLLRAVSGLDRDDAARGAIYEREHKALLRLLFSADPPRSEVEIESEQLAFREAVRKVEFGDDEHQISLVPLGESHQVVPTRAAPGPAIPAIASAIAPPTLPRAPERAWSAQPPVDPQDDPAEEIDPGQSAATVDSKLALAPDSIRPAAPGVDSDHAARKPRHKPILRRAVLAVVLLGLGAVGYGYATGDLDLPWLTELVGDGTLLQLGRDPNAQQAIVIDGDVGNPDAARAAGKAVWRMRTEAAEAQDAATTTVLQLDLEIPERSDGIARDLATVRAELADRIAAEASARMEVAQVARLLETNEKEWTTRLNAERERSDGIARDLATVRAELADRITAEASARMEVAQVARLLEANEKEWTTRLNAERERSDGIARDLATVRAELVDRTIAEASARTANDLTTNIKTGSAMTDRLKTVTVRDPLRMTIDRGGSSISTIVASAVDEAKLIARAQFLIGQGDVAGARHFLERAVEGGSAQAAFLLAETYDWRTLRALQVYGVRGDTKRALELYGAASEGGIDKAKERISALEGAESP